MIGRLRGNILEKSPPLVLIEVYGIGYEVHMPMTCFYELPEINSEATILTQYVGREDSKLLFGFNKKQERTLFRELIKVNGIGPKLAIAILSSMSAQQFIAAIKNEKFTSLIKLPGIGKKTAARLVVEMKDRFNKKYNNLFEVNMASSTIEYEIQKTEIEAVEALIALGYKPQEASWMISKVIKPNTDCETLIRNALLASI
ncbi:Holliday junction branch migration protein RuvA [Pantoea sp. Aalb]|uniref:Holliday junction branch migration protein RuvA n=1 Tax=Pantoea sp. Aalb TaxID=2576762 RepID=UPI00132AAE5A|nr:Holliday junction branch migration protein RuvA [Pantoea sp. Aalb]MXP67361.1 Holliday junction branch migration protein RuvA [Pantoea sp. Aalb]